ncbi:hypothetical protein [Altererythrobacter lutimaris]|uniref:Uncharacterized protein n=1 Tax=Altererythrobacter lutimaris TaxID=2743979 RepID=A0A850HE15_9SPHN|nr:hypothetical protein [Altererythrobacter lutimaris]NVE95371.1 hypothetical protein [Altererythrobacter lutimaris]
MSVALGGALLSGIGAGASAALARSSASIAGQTKLLSRTVERDLKDGQRLVVARSWSISFEPSGEGTAIFGSQRSVAVDAPPRVAAIAQIERARSTDSMFPILLCSHGLIRAAGVSHTPADMEQVVASARAILTKEGQTTGNEAVIRTTLFQISRAPARLIETLPVDLFFPREPLIEVRRPLALETGQSGEFVMRYETSVDPASGLLVRAERVITTILGADRRASRELWTLT